MLFNEFDNLIEVNKTQSSKALSPISVTKLGIIMEPRLRQLEKACLPIEIILEGNSKVFIPLHPSNALSPLPPLKNLAD